MPVLPKFFHHLAPKVTQKQGFLGRIKISSRITGTSTALPHDSDGNSGAVQEMKEGKGCLTLGSSGSNGLGLSKMITLTSLFHPTKWTSDDSTELESQKKFTKTGPEDFNLETDGL